MTTTEKLLRRIEKGGTLDGLAKELGMRKSVLMARIEFMVHAGYLSEINSEKGLRKEKRSAVVMWWWVPVSVQSSGV